jgi:anti-anti-sigma factor
MSIEHLTVDVSPGVREGQRIYKLSGPLTITTLFDFQTAVRAEKSPAMILDLSQVPYIDSAGLGSVVNAHVSCVNTGRQFAIVGMSDRVRSLFQMTRVEKVLPIFTTMDEAEKRFTKPADA